MGNPPWACLRKKDLGWDRGVESKKVVQHVYLVGAKSIYRVAEKDKEYLRDEEEKNQNLKRLIVKYFYIKQTAPKVARFDASYFGGSFTLCGGWAGRYRP